MSGRRTAGALAALVLAGLAGCGSAAARLDAANALRLRGDPRGALAAYQELLAGLGEGALSPAEAAVRLRALAAAGDLAYLELGDYGGAIAYYRRIISLAPGSAPALGARALIGDIFRDRLGDRVAAIAQYADVAGSDSPLAPRYQLEVARQYLELGNREQARIEARVLEERWPTSREADEALLLTAQAWAGDRRPEEAMGAYQALADRRPARDLTAAALEGEAQLEAEAGRLDRALDLYARALPDDPNPEAIRTAIEAVRRRREAAHTGTPGDRMQAFDYGRHLRAAAAPARAPAPAPASPPPAPPSTGAAGATTRTPR